MYSLIIKELMTNRRVHVHSSNFCAMRNFYRFLSLLFFSLANYELLSSLFRVFILFSIIFDIVRNGLRQIHSSVSLMYFKYRFESLQ